MGTVSAGLDWANRTHASCVIDRRGALSMQLDVEHSAKGLHELLQALHRYLRLYDEHMP